MDYICNDCPRSCGARRGESTVSGFCASPSLPRIVRAAPHFGEEPCISGTRGAGTVFFSGCNLRCIYCQNREISTQSCGKMFKVSEFRQLLLKLRDQGVHNIDLVTPTHFARFIAESLDGLELGIPVVWNSSGYESVKTLRMLEGLIQVYLPDLKYLSPEAGRRFSQAPDYGIVAESAIREMVRQRGPAVFGPDGLLRSGVLIRHLILPGMLEESRNVIDFVADNFPDNTVLFSLMSQYTPMQAYPQYPELERTVTAEENEFLIHYMKVRGISSGYWQETCSFGRSNIPDFDGTGLDIFEDMTDNSSVGLSLSNQSEEVIT